MVSGMACFITFSSDEAETRFKKWVVRGNERTALMGLRSFHLQAKVLKVDEKKYLFLWSHSWMFSLSFFLRFMLWLQFRKLRKFVSFDRVNKLDLIESVLDGAFKE